MLSITSWYMKAPLARVLFYLCGEPAVVRITSSYRKQQLLSPQAGLLIS
jgi:hypothetical protein